MGAANARASSGGENRMTRGTYAQFGRPLPHPDRAIDTVLAHARATGWFVEDERTACNVLDIVHPLWLLGLQTTYRRAEIRDGIASLLTSAVGDWIDGAGFAFHAGHGPPGLQGTEMWLSIIYIAADLLGTSRGLGWRPRGVHRLEPIARGRRGLTTVAGPQHTPGMASDEVDDYLAGLPEADRAALEALRRTILEIVPDAVEGISYGSPSFKVGGKAVAGFAAYKDHLSYLPHSGSVLATIAADVVAYKTSKGALQFTNDTRLPKALVKKLIATRRAELA